MATEFEAVIGLEVHAQLSTDSKIFASSSAASGRAPNTQTDPVTLGLPGCLPVLNKRVVDYAIKLGLAVNCDIQRESIFARKHYFYPDLPKGYQISQYDKPICKNGRIEFRLNGEPRSVRLNRIHLEEDAGKNLHLQGVAKSMVDLNRAGVPLVEIVSEPDIRSADEAVEYMKTLRQIVRYIDVCDGNMEEGSLRCDANVSIRPKGQEEFGTKVEIKNLNSFRFVGKAIEFEIKRQIECVQRGEKIVQETRLYDETNDETRSMRSKEQAQDYRYFPCPDLLPLIVDHDWVARIKSSLGELPGAAFNRLRTMYGLDDYFSAILTEEKHITAYYDQAVATHNNPSAIANWVCNELFGRLNKAGTPFENCPISPENLGELVKLIDDGTISGKIAKSVFDEMFESGAAPKSIVDSKGLTQVSDEGAIEALIKSVLEKNPSQVADYRAGKTKMFGFFVGQVMKESGGKMNPQLVNDILTRLLS